MNKCEKCGGKVGKKAIFCPVCGEKVEREVGESMPKGYINIKVFIVAIIVAMAIGGVVGFILSTNRNDKSSNELVNGVQEETTTDNETIDSSKETTESGEEETTQSIEATEEETTQSAETTEKDETIQYDYKIDNYNYTPMYGEVDRKENEIYQMYPDIYSITIFENNFDGLIEGEGEAVNLFNFSGIHFFKSNPRDIIDIDYRYDGYPFESITGYKYYDDFSGMEFLQDIPKNACLRPYGNMVVLTKEYLTTLDPGYYLFQTVLAGPNGKSCGQMIHVIIHDETVNSGNYKPQFNPNTQFYSSEKKNDILLYMNGCLSPIKDVVYDYEVIDKKYYDIVCDGYGIIIHSEFFDMHENNPYISLIIRTESGVKSEIKVAYLNTIP